MIKTTTGDVLQAESEALVNTVNCVGVMGRGIALQFKKKFEENFKAYKKACDEGLVQPGEMFVYDYGSLFNPRFIINFPTKDHWRGKSKMEDIESGLLALIDVVVQRKIHSIAIPPLGCGLGGLEWSDVRPRIKAAFADMPDVEVTLFEPAGPPKSYEMAKAKTKPNMTAGKAAMIGLMRQYRAAAMDPFVTLLEIHKLMYFLLVCGEPIKRLKFNKAMFGPYSETLRHVLISTEGYFTSGYGDGEDDPTKPIEILEEGIVQAERYLDSHPVTKTNFERVANLIAGFETSYGMELLSTVHWVATHEGANNVDKAIEHVQTWSGRKRELFTARHIEIAWKMLGQNNLLPNA